MLHSGIAKAFRTKRADVLGQKTVVVEAETSQKYGEEEGIPSVASVTAAQFVANPTLHQEVFGPFSLVIKCKDAAEMQEVIGHLEGQLTCTIIGTEKDLAQAADLLFSVSLICGRLILNGVPTGVEVGAAMQHGGPFPASTDGRFGSVGPHAMKRFVRRWPSKTSQCPYCPMNSKTETPWGFGAWSMAIGRNNLLFFKDIFSRSVRVQNEPFGRNGDQINQLSVARRHTNGPDPDVFAFDFVAATATPQKAYSVGLVF